MELNNQTVTTMSTGERAALLDKLTRWLDWQFSTVSDALISGFTLGGGMAVSIERGADDAVLNTPVGDEFRLNYHGFTPRLMASVFLVAAEYLEKYPGATKTND